MPSSSYKLVGRLILTEGFDLTTRAILDNGSGPTLIRRQFLSDDTLRRYVYWPTMVVDVYKHVEQCPSCANNRLSERRHTSTMKLFPALEPFSGLAMDFLGPLTTSRVVTNMYGSYVTGSPS